MTAATKHSPMQLAAVTAQRAAIAAADRVEIEFGGVPLTACYRWDSGDAEEMEPLALLAGVVDISDALVAAALRGAGSVGNGYGLTSTDPEAAFWDHICELIAAEIERDRAEDEVSRLEDLGHQIYEMRRAA